MGVLDLSFNSVTVVAHYLPQISTGEEIRDVTPR